MYRSLALLRYSAVCIIVQAWKSHCWKAQMGRVRTSVEGEPDAHRRAAPEAPTMLQHLQSLDCIYAIFTIMQTSRLVDNDYYIIDTNNLSTNKTASFNIKTLLKKKTLLLLKRDEPY